MVKQRALKMYEITKEHIKKLEESAQKYLEESYKKLFEGLMNEKTKTTHKNSQKAQFYPKNALLGMIMLEAQKPPRPTEINEKRSRMGNRPRKTVQEVNYEWEQLQKRAKRNIIRPCE